MKKLFMFLAVAGLATFGASCSGSDDNGGGGTKPDPDPTEKQLMLSADKNDVLVGDAVTFSVKVEGKVEAGAELYDGTTKITSPHTFTTAGEHLITAKKSGFKTSAILSIKVSEKSTEQKQLTLVANPTDVKVGEKVTFIVKEGSDIITNAVITQVGGAVVSNGTWTATAAGTFKFKATKTGAKDSAEVSVVVTEAPVLTGNYITDGTNVEEITSSRLSADATLESDGYYYVYTYTMTDTDGTELEYCVFNIDLYKLDQTETKYEARSLTSLAVFQDPNSTSIILPGTAAAQGNTAFIGGWSSVDFIDFVDYTLDDVSELAFTPVATSFSATGGVTLKMALDGNEVNYEGLFTTQSLGVIAVQPKAASKSLQSKGFSKSDNVVKTVDVKKLRKLKK